MSGLVSDHVNLLLVEIALGWTLVVLDPYEEERIHRALIDLVIVLLQITNIRLDRRPLLDLWVPRLIAVAALFDDRNTGTCW